MRLACVRTEEGPAVAVVVAGDEGDELALLGPADPGLGVVPALAGGVDAVAGRVAGARRLPLPAVELLAPVPRPPKFLAIGLNYADHVAETGRVAPPHPVFFNKQVTCVIGPGAPVHVPRVSAMVDYEGELGVVIGRRCRHVPADRARDVVAGYVVVDDVTVRDWQLRAPTMTLGKSFDTHGPLGPWLVTADEVDDPHRLRIRTWVSGELMQDASTAEMIVDIWQQIETLSTSFTLEPGDVIATGTPAGVGVVRQPPRFLVPGDTVRIEVEGIGVLENPVIAEPEGTGVL